MSAISGLRQRQVSAPEAVTPEGWVRSRLKYALRQIGTGGTPDTAEPSFWTDSRDGVPWVAIADMSDRAVITSTAKRLTRAGLLSKRLDVWPAGTLLMSMYASLGHTAELAFPAATNQAILALLPLQGVDQRFLRYWLTHLRPTLLREANSNTQDNLNAAKVRDLPFLRPPLDQQRRIAAFLDHETSRIDELVQEQERLLKLLAEKAEAIVKQGVTKGLNPSTPLARSKATWLGATPRHWEVVPLKYLVRFVSGGTPSKEEPAYWHGDVPWASAKDMKVLDLHETGQKVTRAAISNGHTSLVDPGTVIVVVRGMILAKDFPVAIAGRSISINQDLKALVPCADVYSRFLAYYLRGTRTESWRRLDEAAHGTKALRMDKWSSLEVAVPPLEEQHRIAGWIDQELTNLQRLIESARLGVHLLQERRSALISAAVTGQIDVRSWRPSNGVGAVA